MADRSKSASSDSAQKIEILQPREVLIIGSGLTGLQAAGNVLKSGKKPTIITKGRLSRDGASIMAEADIALDSSSCADIFSLPGDKEDSPEAFFADILAAGDYLNDQKLVQKHVEKAPQELKILADSGFEPEGLIQAPGHSHPRGVWTSGKKIVSALKKTLNFSRIEVFANNMLIDLITRKNRVVGALSLDLYQGRLLYIPAGAVILATGGAGALYSQTTNPPGLTGDGMAAASRAGADLKDMEFPMFLPFTLVNPPVLRGLPFPQDLSVNLNVHLLNRRGERYLRKWDPENMAQTTRDVNSVAAEAEIARGRGSASGGVYMSFKHLPDNLLKEAVAGLPGELASWEFGGFNLQQLLPDISREALEVKPAYHFWNGGISINVETATGVRGLFAAGEGTAGLHGCNRISGNALTQALVWGAVAGREAAKQLEKMSKISDNSIREEKLEEYRELVFRPLLNKSGISPLDFRYLIQNLADTALRPLRQEKSLKGALEECRHLEKECSSQAASHKGRYYNKEWITALENRNLLQVLKAVIISSLHRQESRGAHYRLDYPETDNICWLKSLELKHREKFDFKLQEAEVELNSHIPPAEKVKYGKMKKKTGEVKADGC